MLAALGRAAVEIGDRHRALFAYDTMLRLSPKPRRPALVHIGRTRALMVLNRRADAKAALREATQDRARERRGARAEGAAQVASG